METKSHCEAMLFLPGRPRQRQGSTIPHFGGSLLTQEGAQKQNTGATCCDWDLQSLTYRRKFCIFAVTYYSLALKNNDTSFQFFNDLAFCNLHNYLSAFA